MEGRFLIMTQRFILFRLFLHCTHFSKIVFFLGNIGVIGLLLENEADILVYDKVFVFLFILSDNSMQFVPFPE
jgi:hypothetical protein